MKENMNNILQVSEYELTYIAYFEVTQQHLYFLNTIINYTMQIQFTAQN